MTIFCTKTKMHKPNITKSKTILGGVQWETVE